MFNCFSELFNDKKVNVQREDCSGIEGGGPRVDLMNENRLCN